jgi:purine-binding chemotaxis protein CheW
MEPIRRQNRSLGQLLVDSGRLKPAQLALALDEQRGSGEALGRILVRRGYVQELDILAALKGLLVVTFEVAGEHFATETLYVREIIRARAAVPVPETPGYIEGLVSLRDRVVPIIDLRKRFSLQPPEISEASRVIVVESPGCLAGLLVDSVGAVLQLTSDQLEPVPPQSGGIPARYLYGLGRRGDECFTILNLEPLLASREVIRLTASHEGAHEQSPA